ncbi:MAG: SusC/RagA family TonB-linked outer membrane protein [Paludibacteraceae bacterium]|nr:SusC/RagA family TonB-linked outer membrane protein [Paludibacteraceae bacterium]
MKKIFTVLTLCLVSLFALADKQISGVVLDSQDQPVIGASVMVKGTSIGTITDYDGEFILEVNDDAKVLVVSFVGMQTQEVAIKERMTIVLHEATEVIQEVVVTGYGNVSKGSFAGSAQAVNAETIENKSPSEISKALAGEVAGVQVVTTSGQPGTNASIRIRGIGTINGGGSPLYVVDGVPYAGDISAIDPGDIASTTILKDATATSLYGSRGAHGVVVITTKKGNSGEEGKIDVDVKYGANMHLLPMYEVVTSPQEYVEMAWMGLYNASGRATEPGRLQDASKLLFGPKGIPVVYNLWDAPGNQLIGSDGKFRSDVHLKPGYENMTSWEDAIFRVGQKADATLRISGGTEKVTYYTSLGYLKDEGYYIGSDYDRFTIRSNVDFKPKKWLKGNLNASYAYSTMNAAGQDGNMNNGFAYVNGMPAVYPVYLYNEDGTIKHDDRTGGLAFDYGMHEGSGRGFGSGINPAGSLLYDRDHTMQHHFTAAGMLEVKFYKDLKLTVNAGLTYLGATNSEFTNAYYGDAAGIGRIYKTQTNRLAFMSNQLLEYNKMIDDHSIRVMAGHESNLTRTSQMYGSMAHVAAKGGDNVLEWGNAVQMSGMTSATSTVALESYLATASYIYDERYGLTANYRADGSSKFAKGHRWGHFGSVGATWMFTNEPFMESVSEWISNGKLRLSWGLLGNQDGVSANLYQDQYSIQYVDGTVAYVWEYKGNPDLTWERSQVVDLGLEFDFHKYLTLEMDYFYKLTDNMLFPRYVAPSLGYSYEYLNGGELENQGVEIQLNVHAVDTRNVKLDIRLNGAHYTNNVKSLPDYISSDTEMIMNGGMAVGHGLYDWNLPTYAGVDAETGQAMYVAYYDANLGSFGTSNSADALQATGKNGNNYISNVYEYRQKYPDADIQTENVTGYQSAYAGSDYVGKSAIPDFAGGFGIDLEAYGVTLAVTCSYGIGGWGYDNTYAQLMSSDKAGSYNWHTDMRGAWNRMMTDEQKQAVADLGAAGIPRLSNGADRYANMASTRFLTSSSFLSLNNIRVGYTFPKKWMEKIKINSLNIYVSADNLAIWSARKGYNPMSDFAATTDSYQYTPLSTIMGGIKLQF